MARSSTIAAINVAIRANASNFVEGIRKSMTSLTAFRKQVAGMAKAAGLVGAGTAIVRLTQEIEGFNQSMARSTAIMGDLSATMKSRLEQTAIDVSRTTQFSAKEAADAYFFLASAGMSAAESMRALPVVAKFAQAGNFDLSTATTLLADSLSALGLKGTDAAENLRQMQKLSDQLTKANVIANASIQEFAESLSGGAAAAAKQLGKDATETLAVLAALASQGIKGREAGTALQIIWRELTRRAQENEAAFRAMNIEVFRGGEMRNTADILADLENRLRGMSDAARLATMSQLGFTAESQKFLNAVIGSSEAIAGYEQSLRSAAGFTADVAGKSRTPMQEAMQRFRAALLELRPVLQGILDILTKIIEATANWGKILGLIGEEMRGGNIVDPKTGLTTAQRRGELAAFALERIPGTNFAAERGRAAALEQFRQSFLAAEEKRRANRQGAGGDPRQLKELTEMRNLLKEGNRTSREIRDQLKKPEQPLAPAPL